MTIQKLYIVYQKKTQQESKKSPGREIFMVGVKGLEPSAFWSQTRRSSQLSYTPRTIISHLRAGGQDRTGDTRIFSPLLYH